MISVSILDKMNKLILFLVLIMVPLVSAADLGCEESCDFDCDQCKLDCTGGCDTCMGDCEFNIQQCEFQRDMCIQGEFNCENQCVAGCADEPDCIGDCYGGQCDMNCDNYICDTNCNQECAPECDTGCEAECEGESDSCKRDCPDEPDVPEFTAVGAGLIFLGAIGLVALKRK